MHTFKTQTDHFEIFQFFDTPYCTRHSNYRPTGNRQAQHVPCGISYHSWLISVVWPL